MAIVLGTFDDLIANRASDARWDRFEADKGLIVEYPAFSAVLSASGTEREQFIRFIRLAQHVNGSCAIFSFEKNGQLRRIGLWGTVSYSSSETETHIIVLSLAPKSAFQDPDHGGDTPRPGAIGKPAKYFRIEVGTAVLFNVGKDDHIDVAAAIEFWLGGGAHAVALVERHRLSSIRGVVGLFMLFNVGKDDHIDVVAAIEFWLGGAAHAAALIEPYRSVPICGVAGLSMLFDGPVTALREVGSAMEDRYRHNDTVFDAVAALIDAIIPANPTQALADASFARVGAPPALDRARQVAQAAAHAAAIPEWWERCIDADSTAAAGCCGPSRPIFGAAPQNVGDADGHSHLDRTVWSSSGSTTPLQ